MDQQCSTIVKHINKCFRCLSLSLTYVSSLINHLINDSLLDASPTVIRMSPQLVNISHRILIDPLLEHCRDSVVYVLKSDMLECHFWALWLKSGVSRQICTVTVCARCAGRLYFYNLSWFHAS